MLSKTIRSLMFQIKLGKSYRFINYHLPSWFYHLDGITSIPSDGSAGDRSEFGRWRRPGLVFRTRRVAPWMKKVVLFSYLLLNCLSLFFYLVYQPPGVTRKYCVGSDLARTWHRWFSGGTSTTQSDPQWRGGGGAIGQSCLLLTLWKWDVSLCRGPCFFQGWLTMFVMNHE